MSKQNCLYSSKDNSKVNSKDDESLINNRVVFHSLKGNDKYNKIINTLLLELVDAINILLDVPYCMVSDQATVNCNEEIKLQINSKHITKGYGFYNEFGYLYYNKYSKNPDNNKIQYELLDLQFANYILTIIDNLRQSNEKEFKTKFNTIEKTCTDAKDKPNNDNTLKVLINSSTELFKIFAQKITDIIIKKYSQPQSQYKINVGLLQMLLFNIFIKYYTYTEDIKTVSKSELLTTPNPVVQDPPQTTPYHFDMVKYNKPTITITALPLQEEQPHNPDKPPNPEQPPNPDNPVEPLKPLYSIKITKGTKIE